MTNKECSEIFAKLSEYLDGELDPDLCAEMAEHIRDCEPCVAFVESLKKSIGLVKGAPETVLPGPVRQELLAQMLAAFEQFKLSSEAKGSPSGGV